MKLPSSRWTSETVRQKFCETHCNVALVYFIQLYSIHISHNTYSIFNFIEMSSQQEILRKIPGRGIWTAPSCDQYLPAYFKDVCDQYLPQPNAEELKPVKVSAVLA